MLRINLWGAPGSGKSSTAARLFSDLKIAGYSIEIVNEYIKKWAYQKKVPKSFDQVYIFGQQIHAEDLIQQSGVGALITDSPLMLQIFYSQIYQLSYWEPLMEIAKQYEQQHSSINIFLDNSGIPYQQHGRYENEVESLERKQQMENFLEKYGIAYSRHHVSEYNGIIDYIEKFHLPKYNKESQPKKRFEDSFYGIA